MRKLPKTTMKLLGLATGTTAAVAIAVLSLTHAGINLWPSDITATTPEAQFIKQTHALADAIVHAEEKGQLPKGKPGAVDLKTAQVKKLGLPLAVPAATVVDKSEWQYSRGTIKAFDGQGSLQPLGTDQADDVLLLTGISAPKCKAINDTLYGAKPGMPKPGPYQPGGAFSWVTGTVVPPLHALAPEAQRNAKEGCVALDRSSNYVYYYVVAMH